MKIIDKIQNNRNIIGVTGACLINNVLYMFLNTFMVAYFITLTNYDYKLISIYYIVEHQITWQIFLNISRILGYLILFIASLFNNMLVFKILLFLVTLVIIVYSKLMISLRKEN